MDWKDLTPIFHEEPLYLYRGYTGFYVCAVYNKISTEYAADGTIWKFGRIVDPSFPDWFNIKSNLPTLLANLMPWRVNLSHGLPQSKS